VRRHRVSIILRKKKELLKRGCGTLKQSYFAVIIISVRVEKIVSEGVGG